VSIGAYVPGANPDYDVAVQSRAAVSAYLTQAQAEHCTFAEASDGLCQLGALLRRRARRRSVEGGGQAGRGPAR
jgi:hypothetical protein